MAPSPGVYEQDPQPTRQGLPRLRDDLPRLAEVFEADNVPRHRRVVFNYDNLAGRPRDEAAYAFAAEHGIKVMEVRPSAHRGLWRLVPDTPHVRPMTDRRPVERSSTRPREQGRGRSRVTRAGPSSDDDPDPPASPFQAAWRSALYLTAGELDTLVSHARIRIALLRRWAA
jgi:hypothetical protein